MLFSGLLFVGVTVIVRHLGTDMPAVEAALIRYVFGLIFLLPMIMKFPWRGLNRDILTLYSLRGLAHGGGVMLWFYAMARIPIAEITAVGYTTPIFTAVGAVLIFRERIHARRFSAILIGFIGMLVILRPGLEAVQAGSLAQVVAALCFAVSYSVYQETDLQRKSNQYPGHAIYRMHPCAAARRDNAMAGPDRDRVVLVGLDRAVCNLRTLCHDPVLCHRFADRDPAFLIPATGLGGCIRISSVW